MSFEQVIKETIDLYERPEKINEEKEVIERYGKIFNPYNLDALTKEEFRSFLLIKNNKHWDGIHRQVNIITQDMEKLKNALKELLDESKPLKDRLDYIFPKGRPNLIKGLGRAVITPILLVVYPKRMGVWNSRSEEALKKLDMYPKFNRGASFSDKYLEINKILLDISETHNISLFKLDAVWWKITEGHEPSSEEEESVIDEISTSFGLEPYLQRFLVDNWEKTPLGEIYEIYNEDGDIMGDQYNTKEVGKIDILAKEKSTNDWVVIELKKGRSSDCVIGQILRYIGWIEKNKVEEDEKVKGIIILNEVDKNLEHALMPLKDKLPISCYIYGVKFSLNEYDIHLG